MAVGPGLCGLAVCNGLYQLSNGVEQTKMNFAMGSLGWSPQDLSYFGSFQGLLGTFAQSTIVMRFLKHFGSAGSFRVGSCFSAVALVLISQSGRPFLKAKAVKAAVFLLAHVIWTGGFRRWRCILDWHRLSSIGISYINQIGITRDDSAALF
jgi:hypothetical protein